MLRRFASKSANREIRRLKSALAESEADAESPRRQLRIVEIERDLLAAVVARDAERVRSETAKHARAVE